MIKSYYVFKLFRNQIVTKSDTSSFFVFIIALLIMICPLLDASAQSPQQLKTDSVFALFKKYFNSRHADSIYMLAGEKFKKEVSLQTSTDNMEQNFFIDGPIVNSSLIDFSNNNNVASYKLVFKPETYILLMNLDPHDKFELFSFESYKIEVHNKLTAVATSNPLLSLLDKKIDSAARPYIQKDNTFGLCIGIIKNGHTTIYNYGETERGNGKLPGKNNIFEIGSITKTFTATILAYYVNEGKMKLSDPITKYLPDSVAPNRQLQFITLEMLSNHTSGLPDSPNNFADYMSDPLNPYKDYNKQALYSYLKNCRLNSKPGEKFAYSNLGFGLLGTILERVSGKTYEQLVKTIICKPLGMESTVQHLNSPTRSRLVTFYDEQGRQTPPWDANALAGCGSLMSTMKDLLIYTKANMIKSNNKLSKAMELTHQITFNKNAKLGLGWTIFVVNGVEYYFHNGGTYGCHSFLAFNAKKNIAVVVLSNSGVHATPLGADIIKRIQE
jgi:CubicO group peptidase (beta-lactamase class C family)